MKFTNKDKIAHSFLKAALTWNLDDEAAGVLIGVPPQSVNAWRSGEPIVSTEDLLARMMIVAQIRTALCLCFTSELANRWMSLPNNGKLFNGQSPLEYVGEHGWPGLYMILRLLHAWAAGN